MNFITYLPVADDDAGGALSTFKEDSGTISARYWAISSESRILTTPSPVASPLKKVKVAGASSGMLSPGVRQPGWNHIEG